MIPAQREATHRAVPAGVDPAQWREVDYAASPESTDGAADTWESRFDDDDELRPHVVRGSD